MCRRVAGSSAPNGSSIRMMRGDRISVRAIATRWRMPPDSSLGYLRASRFTSSPTLAIHSRACSRRSRARHAAALEAERDVVLDRAIVERRVVLEHHAAIGAGPGDRRVRHVHGPFAWPDGAAAGRRSGAARWTCRSPTVRESRRTRPCPAGPGTANVTSRMTVKLAEPLRDVAELDDVRALASSSPSLLGRRGSGNRPRWKK